MQSLRFRYGLLWLPGLLVAWLTGAMAHDVADLQAQILYAFQAEDQRALADLVALSHTALATQPGDAQLRYQSAHASFRYARLAQAAADAERALADCVATLQPLLDRDPPDVEALVLAAACTRSLAAYRSLEAPLLRRRAAKRLQSAYAVDPHNPRVLLVLAEGELATGATGSLESTQALAHLRLAADLFARLPVADMSVPGWGEAEACLELGLQLQRRGDVLGARGALERALIVAPDYRAAQRARAGLMDGAK